MPLLTPEVILDKAFDRYELNTVIMKVADGQYSSEWGESSAIGDHVTIRLPIYARGRRGEKADPQQLNEIPALLRIPEAFGSDSLLSDRQLSMELSSFESQVLNPHIDRVSSDVSSEACKTMAMSVSNFVGTPGLVPTSLDTYQSAHRILSQGGAPAGINARSMLVDANMDQYAVAAGRTFQNPVVEISDQYKYGTMGLFGGAKWSMEQSLYQHTIGNLGGTPRVDGAVASGATTINLKGWTASVTKVLAKGDKLWVAGCFQVHPTNGRVYADYQAVTVAADVDSDGAGKCTVQLMDSIISSPVDPYTNMSALPADNALVSVWGQAAAGQAAIAGINVTLGILMHSTALVYASPDLEMPGDVDKLSGQARSNRMKIAMRVWRASDIMTGVRVTRLDMLCGFLVAQPRKACLIIST